MLCEVAEGICARAYFFKCSPQKRDCLVNADWLKLRQRLDKSFPEFNDINKVRSYQLTLKICSTSVCVGEEETRDACVMFVYACKC